MAWVVRKELAQKINGYWRSCRDELLQGFLLDFWILLKHVVQEILVADLFILDRLRRKTKELNDELEVLIGGLGFYENIFGEKFGNHTAQGPHVYGRGVDGLIVEVELWRPVVSGGHVLGEVVILVDSVGHDV